MALLRRAEIVGLSVELTREEVLRAIQSGVQLNARGEGRGYRHNSRVQWQSANGQHMDGEAMHVIGAVGEYGVGVVIGRTDCFLRGSERASRFAEAGDYDAEAFDGIEVKTTCVTTEGLRFYPQSATAGHPHRAMVAALWFGDRVIVWGWITVGDILDNEAIWRKLGKTWLIPKDYLRSIEEMPNVHEKVKAEADSGRYKRAYIRGGRLFLGDYSV